MRSERFLGGDQEIPREKDCVGEKLEKLQLGNANVHPVKLVK